MADIAASTKGATMEGARPLDPAASVQPSEPNTTNVTSKVPKPGRDYVSLVARPSVRSRQGSTTGPA